MTKLWLADLEFQTQEQEPRRVGSGSSIQFLAPNIHAAVADVERWWQNRHEALPEHFHRLCAVKVYLVTPQTVQPGGSLPMDHGMFKYEWKLDFPWQLGEGMEG